MRKKVFFRVFCFTALAVIATVVLITLALTVAHGDTGALTGAIIRKELPYVLGILAAVLGASVPVSYAITGAIIQPLEQLGEHIDHIDRVQTEKELRPFVEKIQANNEKKRQLEKQKKQFTANVSHELKTPLTSIAGYAELIENGMARPEDIKPFAHTIRKQALRLVSLAEDIIQLSQLEENDGEILFEEVNLTELASDCVQSLQINAQSRTVDLRLEALEAPIYIKGNKSLLEELLYNLCDNAIRYNKPQGSVTVTLRPEQGGTALQWQTPASAYLRSTGSVSLNASSEWTKAAAKKPAAPGWGWPSSSILPRCTTHRWSWTAWRGKAQPLPCTSRNNMVYIFI